MRVLCHFTNIQSYIHIKETYGSAIVDLDINGRVVILANEEDYNAYEEAWIAYQESQEFPMELLYH